MKDTKSETGEKSPEDRKAAALRANLAKRKGQGSARRSGKAVGKTEPSAFDNVRDQSGRNHD